MTPHEVGGVRADGATAPAQRLVSAEAVDPELWLQQRYTAWILVSGPLIAVIHPSFHFILGLIPNAPPDSLTTRLVSAAVSVLIVAIVLVSRHGRRWSPPLQFVNVATLLITTHQLVIDSGYHAMYLAASLTALYGAHMAFFRMREWVATAVLSLGYHVVVSLMSQDSFFEAALMPTLYYASNYSITTALVFLRVRLYYRDLRQRQDLDEANRALATSVEEQRRLNSRLSETAAELDRSYKKLRSLDEAKSQFFANVSHELRSPLMMVIGPLESLLEDEPEGSRRSAYISMSSNARRLLRHVNAILDIARLESDRMRLDLEQGDPSIVLSRLVEAARPHAQHRGIELGSEGTPSLELLPFDAEKLEIIAANLLSNALKFTPRGGQVAVRWFGDAEGMSFEVEDDGPGIPESERDRVFEPFVQGDASASREYEGTGLGLALARDLARLHGGDITISTGTLGGALFRVIMPRTDTASPALADEAARRTEKMLAHHRSRAETLLADVSKAEGGIQSPVIPHAPEDAAKVLLVEDNRELAALLAVRLGRTYRVLTAFDGQEGLALARRRQPDVIVSDVMMPRMDGLEMVREIRRDPRFARTPVILATAKAGVDALKEGLEVGADDYVTKPFDLRELEARVAAHLRRLDLDRQIEERNSRLIAVGRMTAEIVHDMKNPISGIRGMIEVLRAAAPETELDEDLASIGGAAGRLLRMADELLAFCRGAVARLDARTVQVSTFLTELVDSQQHIFEASDIELVSDIRIDRELTVSFDPERMQRVLENLLSNAREALTTSNTSDPRVVLIAHAEGERLDFEVVDNGPGIEPRARAALFEPFVSRGKSGGTGLGLATARNLVLAHGGVIEIAAGPDARGTAVQVRLPAAGVGRVDSASASL